MRYERTLVKSELGSVRSKDPRERQRAIGAAIILAIAYGSGSKLGEVAEHLNVEAATISRVFHRLRNSGYFAEGKVNLDEDSSFEDGIWWAMMQLVAEGSMVMRKAAAPASAAKGMLR